ncbi:MAG: N-acetyl-alpha-D-glucosaminyl L-malate synthase BshA [Bacteroidota bacterium]
MKIGMVCYPTYGGSGIVATELGKELAKRGHEVHFISYATPTRLDSFLDNIYYHEVEIPHYPLFEFHLYTLALAGKMIDVIKYEKLDILHVHYAVPHAVSGILTRDILAGRNFKLVTTLHGTDITLVGLEPAFHPIVKYSLDKSDAVTSVSNYLKERTILNFNTEKEIDVIYNFIDTDEFTKKECSHIRKNFAADDESIIMHISNFRPVKRVQDTIRILSKVLEKKKVKLVLIGDGPERSECERLARELNISDKVRFLGKQQAVPELLSCAELFLLPSQSESFGLSELEAMSCGVPVVAANIGGIPEVVSHGETGFIAEMGDISRMARYVTELLTNKKKWETFSENSFKRAKEHFDSKMIISQYEQLYSRLFKGQALI